MSSFNFKIIPFLFFGLRVPRHYRRRVRRPRRTARADRPHYLKHKKEARRIILEKVEAINQIYQFPYKKIFIKNQRTRWGSCSSLKNLNFNFKIAFLPEAFLNYVIAHELCHLKEMNHSVRFWALVAQTVPNYRAIRRDLRKMQQEDQIF